MRAEQNREKHTNEITMEHHITVELDRDLRC